MHPFKTFALVFILLHFLLMWALPHSYYTWSIDFLRYLPISFQIFWYLFGIIAIWFIPDRKLVGSRQTAVSSKLQTAYYLLPTIFVSIVIMFLFREKYHLIGDPVFQNGLPRIPAWHRLSELIVQSNIQFVSYFHLIPAHVRLEIVAYLLSILHGGIFVFISVLFAREFGKTISEQIFLFLFLVTGQYMFIFFGHGENYYTVLVIFLWYLYELFRMVEGRGVVWRLVLSCLLAIYSHPEGFALVPSCFLAYYFYAKDKQKTRILVRLGLVIAIAYVVLLKLTGQIQNVFEVPLFVEKNYSLPFFSIPKISYLINGYLANAFVGMSLFVVVLFSLPKKFLSKERDKRPVWILLITIPFFVICDIFVEHAMGVSDQDLCALSAFVFAVFGIWFYLRYFHRSYSFSMVTLNVWLLIPMIYVLHTYANVSRMTYLYPYDINTFSPHIRLGMMFRNEPELRQEAAEQFRLGMADVKPEHLTLSKLQYCYWMYESGRIQEGRAVLTNLLETEPDEMFYYLKRTTRFSQEFYTDIIQFSQQMYQKTKSPIYLKIGRLLK